MYRINVYRDREAAGRRLRRRLAGAAFLGVGVGLEVVLIAVLAISGGLLQDRARNLETTLAGIQAQAATPVDGPRVAVARQLLQQRSQRIDWAAKLQAIGETVPDDVVLSRIKAGLIEFKGRYPAITLEGRAVGNGGIESFQAFVAALAAHPGIRADFPEVVLENVEARNKTFRISCRRSRQAQ